MYPSIYARVIASDSYDIGAVTEIKSRHFVVKNSSGGVFHIPFGSIREVKAGLTGTVVLSCKLDGTPKFRQS